MIDPEVEQAIRDLAVEVRDHFDEMLAPRPLLRRIFAQSCLMAAIGQMGDVVPPAVLADMLRAMADGMDNPKYLKKPKRDDGAAGGQ